MLSCNTHVTFSLVGMPCNTHITLILIGSNIDHIKYIESNICNFCFNKQEALQYFLL